LAAVPAVLEGLGRGAVPHDQARLARRPGDEVLKVAPVAGERLVAVVRGADGLGGDAEAAAAVEDDGFVPCSEGGRFGVGGGRVVCCRDRLEE